MCEQYTCELLLVQALLLVWKISDKHLFAFSCQIFLLAASRGVLTTMENPSNAYFWMTCWVRDLLLKVTTFETNFQVCMFGGSRDKWTKILASFKTIETLDARCNRQHKHAPWGFAFNDEGHQVWATSLESRFPCKMCRFDPTRLASCRKPGASPIPSVDLAGVENNPLMTSLRSQGGAQRQPKRLPLLVPDFESVANFLCEDVTNLPCALQSKLPAEKKLWTKTGRLQTIPKHSRLLPISAFQPDHHGGCEGGHPGKRAKLSEGEAVPTLLHFTAIHYQLNIRNFQSTKVVRGFSGCGSVCTAGFKGMLVNQLFNIEVVPPTCTVVKPCDLEKLSWNPCKRTIFRCQNNMVFVRNSVVPKRWGSKRST